MLKLKMQKTRFLMLKPKLSGSRGSLPALPELRARAKPKPCIHSVFFGQIVYFLYIFPSVMSDAVQFKRVRFRVHPKRVRFRVHRVRVRGEYI